MDPMVMPWFVHLCILYFRSFLLLIEPVLRLALFLLPGMLFGGCSILSPVLVTPPPSPLFTPLPPLCCSPPLFTLPPPPLGFPPPPVLLPPSPLGVAFPDVCSCSCVCTRVSARVYARVYARVVARDVAFVVVVIIAWVGVARAQVGTRQVLEPAGH
jgi:hypothetical protein